jgi:two-component system OmpR family sensor kinase
MRWYRSLYWRFAFGVVALLAAMLVVQAMLFVWGVSQSGRTLPGQSPGRLGATVALDLTSAIERDPQIDLERYVREQYAQYTHPFFVMMTDGRLITSGSRSFPEPLLQMARARLQRRADRPEGERPPGPRFRSGAVRPDRPPPDWWELPNRFDTAVDRFERGPNGVRFVRPSPIVVGGRLTGIVVVPPQAPFGFLLGRFAPLLGLVAVGVLIVGTALTSVMIFGPTRRRLRALEHAARQLGGGDLSARAPDRGGDEIAEVASAFNAMAADLSARADALAASDRARRQLLADVSHELTTPVTAMRGYLETLTMSELALDDATRGRYLTIIADETARLERLIGDLLDLARLEGGGGALYIEPVPVEQLFARVAARHERACVDAGVTMATAIAPGAEALACDRNRLEQALQNLAANALRYAPRGSTVRLLAAPGACLDTAVAQQGAGAASPGMAPCVTISVEDEGPGIAPEHVPHVFDRFYKADASRAPQSSDGAPGGSGLGLSIVKAIIERHGGRITVRSEPGHTVFEMSGLQAGLAAGEAGGSPHPS